MRLDFEDQEAELIRILLVKELGETRVEIRHARNIEFKAGLERREKLLRSLRERLDVARFESDLAGVQHSLS